MQAVILVGGQGTRLRPLTSTVPKPVVTLVDRPFISFMLEWLRGHRVDDVIMSCGFLAGGVRAVLGDGSALGIRLRFIEEPDPRGTAGAVKLAEPMLDERFLMLNGDVLTDIDLTAQIAQHEATGASATLSLVPVADPTAYGLVLLEEDRSVREFIEKPSSDKVESNLISAGAYVLQRSILDLVPPDRNVSIEREVWPRLLGDGLYGFPSEGYWLDIGTPSATSRRPSTSSRATCGRRWPSGSGATGWPWMRPRRCSEGSCLPRCSGAGCAWPRGHTWGASRCSLRTSRSAPAPRWSARSCSTAPRSARAASFETASSPRAAASARAVRSAAVRCSERA